MCHQSKWRCNELSHSTADAEPQEDSEESLRARIEKLEGESQEILRQTERRVILSELKVEAVRAGMVDLDGLTFLDLSQVHLRDDGILAGGAEVVAQLRRAKPWLFSGASSSSVASVPPSKPSRQKLATEMTDAEYRIAKANIIKRSAL
jgi:hypothetical protein